MPKRQPSRGASNQQVARAGEHFVTAELNKRGAFAVTFAGNMPKIDLMACNQDRNSGPGGPGRFPARGSHRPERAQLTHSVPQVILSLRHGTPSGSPAGKAQGNAPRAGETSPTDCATLAVAA